MLQIELDLCAVWVWTTATAEGSDNIDESSVVLDASLSTAGLLLFLFLFFNFRCLSLNFTGTSQWTVHFTSQQWNGQVQFEAGQCVHWCEQVQHGSFTWQCEFSGIDLLQSSNFVLQFKRKRKKIEWKSMTKFEAVLEMQPDCWVAIIAWHFRHW